MSEKVIKMTLPTKKLECLDLDSLIIDLGDKHEQRVSRLIGTTAIDTYKVFILIESTNDKTNDFKKEILKHITGILEPVFVYRKPS